jgi:hypothetical protein
MAKIRVHELAEELKLETKVVLVRANELGIPVRSHMASLDEEEAEALRTALLAPPVEKAPEDPGLPKIDEEQEAVPAVEAQAAEDVASARSDSSEGEAVPPAEGAEGEAVPPAEGAEGAQAEPADRPEPGNERDQKPRDPNRGRRPDGRRGPGGPQGGRGRREQPLSQEDPYWQFGTPPEYWGQTRGDRRTDPSGLPPDDPYWQFGSPVESWGSSRKKAGQADANRPQQQRPRTYLECQTCGVKIEKKRAHGDKKVPCPFCNRWMKEVR